MDWEPSHVQSMAVLNWQLPCQRTSRYPTIRKAVPLVQTNTCIGRKQQPSQAMWQSIWGESCAVLVVVPCHDGLHQPGTCGWSCSMQVTCQASRHCLTANCRLVLFDDASDQPGDPLSFRQCLTPTCRYMLLVMIQIRPMTFQLQATPHIKMQLTLGFRQLFRNLQNEG